MTYVLDKACVAGGVKIAIVSRLLVGGHVIRPDKLAVYGNKVPKYVVVQSGQGRVVLDMTGATVALHKVSALCAAVEAHSR